ncbi:hypothetical protein SYNPS1DRAFT_22859 [Syncephalis pseudoplumigaleata]|uniref:Uncharacterized protein n=1 Tax=Syncephalis pseudoplumigaleata TaxID=1712513 RepID=A0A4P9YYG5_9FUNG|nr:hypothetical protein SYNPS1DRAFT_22859 [Syncephalis pseudoplumigaleata]|eukprot:RKP25137.1 hypothetical protein SYNPS1DRAFT_22859 [Syncephalis pseudoplumigaleata]
MAETWLANLTDATFEAVTRVNASMAITNRELSDSTVLLSHTTSTATDADASMMDSSAARANEEEETEAEHNPMKRGYERVIELYTLHALPRLNEWETAREFLTYNDMLDTATQKMCLKSLKRLEKAARKAASTETPPDDGRHGHDADLEQYRTTLPTYHDTGYLLSHLRLLLQQGWQKLVQTIKMGTTVTYV